MYIAVKIYDTRRSFLNNIPSVPIDMKIAEEKYYINCIPETYKYTYSLTSTNLRAFRM
jgi:hypothetical protein